MCTVSSHAVMRAKERWGLNRHPNIDEVIRETYEQAQLIGEYVDKGRPQQLFLHKQRKRVVIVNPVDDKVVTVWRTDNTPLAIHLYDEVIRLHRRRITSFERKWRTIAKRYNAERDTLMAERDMIQREIARLKTLRDHIDATLHNYEYDMDKLSQQKKSTIHSLANYLTFDESEHAQEV